MLIGLPNCFAGQTLSVGADGSYVCRENFTAQTLGVEAPDCGGGTAYLDPLGSWACTAPPVQQKSGGTAMVIFAVIVAAVAFWYFGKGSAEAIHRVSKGKLDDFSPIDLKRFSS